MTGIGALKDFKRTKDSDLEKMGFSVSRELSIHSKTFPQGEFLVDDQNKKFAIRYLDVIQKKSFFGGVEYKPVFKVFDYSDLGPYELAEDGNSIVQGKGISSAVGAMTFGVAGAIVGGSGKRKQQQTCASLSVKILVNDLQNPQLEILFLDIEIKKSSSLYKQKLQQAQELIGILNYISKNT